MRVIDCDCGATVQAANEDDLKKRVREHLVADHPDMSMSDDEVAQLIEDRSYEAVDS